MKNEEKKTKEEQREEEMRDVQCKNCKGGFVCQNPSSYCYGYHCGEYPGTGPY